MFTERQNLLLQLLREQGRSTGDSLADTLKVSKRTVYRDLGALIEAGIPIRTEGGPGGGIWIEESRSASQPPSPPSEPHAANGFKADSATAIEPRAVARDASAERSMTIAEAEEAYARTLDVPAKPAELTSALASVIETGDDVNDTAEADDPDSENPVSQEVAIDPVQDPISAWFDAAFGRRSSEIVSQDEPIVAYPVHEVEEEVEVVEAQSAAPEAVLPPQPQIANAPGVSLNLAATVRERIFLDASGWWQEEMPSQVVVDLLQEAIFTNRAMRVQFHPAATNDGFAGLGATTRVIEPYGLVAKAGIWYLVSRQGSHFVADRLSRIASAEQLSNRFERAAGFELETWWSRSGDQFARGNENYRFSVLVRKSRVEFLRMYVGGRLQVDPVDAQWARARLEVASPEAAVMIVLGLGPDAVVIEPEELPLYVRRAAAGRPLHEASAPARPTPSYALG